jgi:hypothetical protein
MKFPRTIQLDSSDGQVYERPAIPGEWAVPGSFAFLDVDLSEMTSKQRQAFGRGFLGTESFGWSTLVEVAEIDAVEYEAVVQRLANHFVDHCGAPNLDAALPLANEEATFATSICDHQLHTLLALERESNEGGIAERFKVVQLPSAAGHDDVKLWTLLDDE